MNLFRKSFGFIARAIVPVAIASVSPEALINTTLGAVVKHGMAKVPNDAIPYLNFTLSTAVAYGRTVAAIGDWVGSIAPALQTGVILMALSTALHQSTKLILKDLCPTGLAKRIGPGNKCSF